MERTSPTLLSTQSAMHEAEIALLIEVIADALANNPTLNSKQLTADISRAAFEYPSTKAGLTLLMAETEAARRRGRAETATTDSPWP